MYDDWYIDETICSTTEMCSSRRGAMLQCGVPFSPIGGLGIIIYDFLIKSSGARNEKMKIFTIVIGPDVISTLAEAPRESNILEWKDWGPLNTRCFFNLYGREFPEEVCGVNIYHNRFNSGGNILDFNQLDIARDLARGEEVEGIVNEPTTIPSDSSNVSELGIFLEPVVSSLPYRNIPIPLEIGSPHPLLFKSRTIMEELIMSVDWKDRSVCNLAVYHSLTV